MAKKALWNKDGSVWVHLLTGRLVLIVQSENITTFEYDDGLPPFLLFISRELGIFG